MYKKAIRCAISSSDRCLQKISFFLIKSYQYSLGPLFYGRCRFLPTCSVYALEAIKIHGFFKGIYLIFKRLLRCHPGCAGGIDDVPEKQG